MLWSWCLIWEIFYTSNMSDHTSSIYKRVGGQRHCVQRVEHEGEDQGGRWHLDVSFKLKFSSRRTFYGLLMVVDMKLVYSFNISDLIKYMWVGGRRHCGRQGQQGGEDQGGRWYLYVSHQIYISWNFLQLECDMLWWWRLTWNLFIPSTCLTTLSQCELVVDGTVDNKDRERPEPSLT